MSNLSTEPGLSRDRLYNPAAFMKVMEIGRNIYVGLLAQGMPHVKIQNRVFFSGRQVIDWLEELGKDPERRSKAKKRCKRSEQQDIERLKAAFSKKATVKL